MGQMIFVFAIDDLSNFVYWWSLCDIDDWVRKRHVTLALLIWQLKLSICEWFGSILSDKASSNSFVMNFIDISEGFYSCLELKAGRGAICLGMRSRSLPWEHTKTIVKCSRFVFNRYSTFIFASLQTI